MVVNENAGNLTPVASSSSSSERRPEPARSYKGGGSLQMFGFDRVP